MYNEYRLDNCAEIEQNRSYKYSNPSKQNFWYLLSRRWRHYGTTEEGTFGLDYDNFRSNIIFLTEFGTAAITHIFS
jgi:hypothetical protein